MSKFKSFIKKNLKIRWEIILTALISFLIGVGLHSGVFSLWPLYALRENVVNISEEKEALFPSFLASNNKQFLTVWDNIRFNFLDKDNKLDEDEFLKALTSNLVEELHDDFSNIEVIDKEEKAVVGIMIAYNDDKLVEIKELVDEYPAKKANLREGDIFIEIDGQNVVMKNLDEIKSLLKGEENKEVSVLVMRPSNKRLIEKKLNRMKLENYDIDLQELENGIYKLKINSFSDDLYEEFTSIFDEVEHDKIKSLIIDLRSNPGGNLLESIKVISDLLEEDLLILSQEHRDSEVNEYRTGKSNYPFLINIPKIILMDNTSASCSEILSLALRDHADIQIVGENSFGKGVITREFQIGDKEILNLTISKWFGPRGEYIHKIGIKPDIQSKNPLETAIQIIN